MLIVQSVVSIKIQEFKILLQFLELVSFAGICIFMVYFRNFPFYMKTDKGLFI